MPLPSEYSKPRHGEPRQRCANEIRYGAQVLCDDLRTGVAEDAEHPFAEDVPLDLVGAAPDRDRGCGEEQREPFVLADQASQALDVDGQVGHGLDGGCPAQLGARSLGPGRAPGPSGLASPQVGETADLEQRHNRAQPLSHESVVGVLPSAQEIEEGIFFPDRHDALCFFRTIQGVPDNAEDIREYIDLPGSEGYQQLADLKRRLRKQCPPSIPAGLLSYALCTPSYIAHSRRL